MTDANLISWIDVPAGHDFPLANLPFGIFSTPDRSARPGMRLGDQVLDLSAFHVLGLLNDLGLSDLTEGFSLDEYEIRTLGTRLVIAGAPPRGTINGMYGFLQDHLGCRWFTPAASRIPKDPHLTIDPIADRQKPDFLWRTAASVRPSATAAAA